MPFTSYDIQHQRQVNQLFIYHFSVYYFLDLSYWSLLLFSIGIKKADFDYFVVWTTFYLTCLATALTLAAIPWLHAIIGG